MSKITLPRATVQQALEALELLDEYDNTRTMLTDDAIDEVLATADAAIAALRAALEQPEQEPAAWSTRERFYEALDRAVENVRQEMRIKTVTMRSKDFDAVLPIIDAYSGHVLVGDAPRDPPRREWRGLTEEEIIDAVRESDLDWYQGWTLEYGTPNRYAQLARAIEAALKERNA